MAAATHESAAIAASIREGAAVATPPRESAAGAAAAAAGGQRDWAEQAGNAPAGRKILGAWLVISPQAYAKGIQPADVKVLPQRESHCQEGV